MDIKTLFLNQQEIAPADAKKVWPLVLAEQRSRVQAREKADAEVARRDAVRDDNRTLARFLMGAIQGENAKLQGLILEARQELHALREGLNFEHAARIRAQRDRVSYLESELTFLNDQKIGADEISYLEAVELAALAASLEAHGAAVCSRVAVAASVEAQYAETGRLAIIDERTITLEFEAKQADWVYEQARTATKEARERYAKQRAALEARGMVTSMNISHINPR